PPPGPFCHGRIGLWQPLNCDRDQQWSARGQSSLRKRGEEGEKVWAASLPFMLLTASPLVNENPPLQRMKIGFSLYLWRLSVLQTLLRLSLRLLSRDIFLHNLSRDASDEHIVRHICGHHCASAHH